MRLTSYAGLSFATLGVSAGIPNDHPGPDVQPQTMPRPGGPPIAVSPLIGVRSLPVVFQVLPGSNLETAFAALLGALDPLNGDERTLAGARLDGTTVAIGAQVGPWTMLARNQLQVVFWASDPVWRAVTTTPVLKTITSAADATLTVPLAGHVAVSPVVRLRPTAQRTARTADVGWSYRKTHTLALSATVGVAAVAGLPWSLDLGDSAALIAAGKARADGTDVRVLVEGRSLPRLLIAWGSKAASLWFNIPYLPAGESLAVDVVYGNPSGTVAPALVYPEAPAFAVRGDYGTSSGTNTTTTLNDTAKNWGGWGQWTRGYVQIVGGTGVGQGRVVIANTATQLTVETAWTTTPNATSEYVVTVSQNDRLVWDVGIRPNEVGVGHGAWYTNRGDRRPSIIDHEIPCAWRREKTLEFQGSTDDEYQKDVTKGEYLGVSYWQTRFDAARYPAKAKEGKDEGTGDGVTLYHPLGVTAVYWDHTITNKAHPKTGVAVGKLVVLTAESAAAAWDILYETETVHTTPFTDNVITKLTSAPYPKRIGFAIWPQNEANIPRGVAPTIYTAANWENVAYLKPNAAEITVTVGAETAVYQVAATVRAGGAAAVAPYDELEIGRDRWLLVALGDLVEVDTDAGTAAVWDATRTTKRFDCPWAVEAARVEPMEGAANARLVADDWLSLRPGTPNPDVYVGLDTGPGTIEATVIAAAGWY